MTPKTQAEIILENYGLSHGAHAKGLASTIERVITAAIEEERGIWNEVERQRFDVTYHHGDSVWHAVNYDDFTVGAGASPREAVEALLAKLASTA